MEHILGEWRVTADAVDRVDSFIYCDRLWTREIKSLVVKKKSQYELVFKNSEEDNESKIKEHCAV